MGQAACTAAALAVKINVTPKELDVTLLQDALIRQGAKTSVKYISKEVLAPYKAIQKMNLVFQR